MNREEIKEQIRLTLEKSTDPVPKLTFEERRRQAHERMGIRDPRDPMPTLTVPKKPNPEEYGLPADTEWF